MTDPRAADEEQRLIQRVVLASDTQAFDALTRPYLGRLRGYLRGLTMHDSDADDRLQTTLIKAWQELHRFDHRGRFVAWLFRIAHREFLQGARAGKRYHQAMARYDGQSDGMSQSGDQAAAAMDIETILGSMHGDSRAAIILSRAVGLTHAEIAQAMDKPLGSVKSLLTRATQEIVAQYG
ncbi:MAG: RNA polymerase sigma factor [Pseudomonadota bacterium]